MWFNKTKFSVAAIAACTATCATLPAPASPTPAAHPIIVELFTSEGCSSCPPADKLLRRLEETQPIPGATIIGLEEHVDYWNNAAWTDPFSSSQFSNRQIAYVAKFGNDTYYTPEMVVSGRAFCVGSDTDSAYREIRQAAALPGANVSLKPVGNTVTVDAADLAPGRYAVYLAVTQADLISNPTGGENGGAILVHSRIVRSLREIGITQGGGHKTFSAAVPVSLSPSWPKSQLSYVAFIQRSTDKTIVGAAQIHV